MENHVSNDFDHSAMQFLDEGKVPITEVPQPDLPHVIKQSTTKPEEAIVSMNGSQCYYDEWNQLFKQVNYSSIIKNRAFTGGLRSCRYRSICWKVFLHCLPDEQSQWLQVAQLAHAQYDELKSKILINPRLGTKSVDPFINNPLSQEESSPWNQYFQDTELKLTINQDVIRTFPEIEFFQLPEVREIMVNILFCYAREHPQISYRQGMHELLAPLIFVLHSDQQAFLHADEIDFTDFFGKYQKETLRYLLNDAYLEHDAYSMFCNMMDHVEAWYLIRDTNPSKFSLLNVRPFARLQDVNAYNIIISKLTYIHDLLLRRHDHDLYIHLEKMEIAPQIYGIRWLRLLFGREFSLQDLLVIWDVIFADGSHFGLVDYVFISMLIYIRTPLLSSDYATCLGYLMRYPMVTDVHYIIDMALHLRDPKLHPRPAGYNHLMLRHIPTVGGRPDVHRATLSQRSTSTSHEEFPNAKPNVVFSGISSLKRKVTNRPKSLAVSSNFRSSTKPKETQSSSETGSQSPDIGEFTHSDANPNLRKISLDLDKNASVSRSNPALADLETELKPIQRNYLEKSSTLPRYFGIHGKRKEVIVEDEPEVENHKTNVGRTPANVDEAAGSLATLKRHNVSQELNHLHSQIQSMQSMSVYCAEKMTSHIDSLQECILKQRLENEDEMLIALAGMKQVRDILKGTLKFNQNMMDSEEITINDDSYYYDKKKEQEQPRRSLPVDVGCDWIASSLVDEPS